MKPKFITPGCCGRAKKLVTVRLHVARSFFMGDRETPPTWVVDSFNRQWEMFGDPQEAKFCPYCGKAVPLVVKREEPLKKVCSVTDGGYYCDTCKERLNGCNCLEPEFHWQVVGVNGQ